MTPHRVRTLARAILGDIIRENLPDLRAGVKTANFYEMLDAGRDIYKQRVGNGADELYDRLVAGPALKIARTKFDPYYVGLRVQRKHRVAKKSHR